MDHGDFSALGGSIVVGVLMMMLLVVFRRGNIEACQSFPLDDVASRSVSMCPQAHVEQPGFLSAVFGVSSSWLSFFFTGPEDTNFISTRDGGYSGDSRGGDAVGGGAAGKSCVGGCSWRGTRKLEAGSKELPKMGRVAPLRDPKRRRRHVHLAWTRARYKHAENLEADSAPRAPLTAEGDSACV